MRCDIDPHLHLRLADVRERRWLRVHRHGRAFGGHLAFHLHRAGRPPSPAHCISADDRAARDVEACSSSQSPSARFSTICRGRSRPPRPRSCRTCCPRPGRCRTSAASAAWPRRACPARRTQQFERGPVLAGPRLDDARGFRGDFLAGDLAVAVGVGIAAAAGGQQDRRDERQRYESARIEFPLVASGAGRGIAAGYQARAALPTRHSCADCGTGDCSHIRRPWPNS